jgi:tetratricopeptide (TPR) repeat protein
MCLTKKEMKKIVLLILACLVQTSLFAQDDVSIGKNKRFQSGILVGEVTYLVHLPDGYDNSRKDYPVIYMMNGQSVSSFANAASTLDNLSNERLPEIKSHFGKLSAEYGFTVIPKAGVLFDMAIDNKNEKEYERAIELFKYLISLYPGSEIYHYVLGQTYQQKGDIDLAKESYNESLKINPEFKQAKTALEKINKYKQ